MRVHYQQQHFRPVTNAKAITDMFAKWLGTQPETVLSANVADRAKASSEPTVTSGVQINAASGPGAIESDLSLLSDSVQLGELSSPESECHASVMIPSIPAQKAPISSNEVSEKHPSTRAILFEHKGAPVGFGITLDPLETQNPASLVSRTSQLFRRLDADPQTLQRATDVASTTADFLKHAYSDQGALIDSPVAVFAIVNSLKQGSRAYKSGDRFEVGHYTLDGFAHSLDLGVNVTTIIDELTHTAAGSGVATLNWIALGLHVLNSVYVFFGPRD